MTDNNYESFFNSLQTDETPAPTDSDANPEQIDDKTSNTEMPDGQSGEDFSFEEFFGEPRADAPEAGNTDILEIGDLKFNLADPQDYEKLKTTFEDYAKVKTEYEGLSSRKTEIDSIASQMTDAIKLMYSKELFSGSVDEENLIEKPYEYYLEEADGDKKQAMALWKEDKAKLQRLNEFAQKFSESAQKLVTIKAEFAKEHPDIKDVDSWVRENVNPILQPILSYGEEPLSKDFFEMVYFWKNKNSIFAQYRDKVLKDISKTPVKKTTGTKPVAVTSPNKGGESPIDDAIKAMLKKYDGQKVLLKNYL